MLIWSVTLISLRGFCEKQKSKRKGRSVSVLFSLFYVPAENWTGIQTRAEGLSRSATPRTVRLPTRVLIRLPFFSWSRGRAWPSDKWNSMSRWDRVCRDRRTGGDRWGTVRETKIRTSPGLTWLSDRPLFSGTNSVDWTVRVLRRFTNCFPDSDTWE